MARNRIKMQPEFLKTLKNQGLLFKGDPVLIRLLYAKAKDVRGCYKDANAAFRTWNTISGMLRSIMPWQIIKYFE